MARFGRSSVEIRHRGGGIGDTRKGRFVDTGRFRRPRFGDIVAIRPPRSADNARFSNWQTVKWLNIRFSTGSLGAPGEMR